MLSVLIIDDEPIIREGLRAIIDWDSFGFHICDEAENAIIGLEKIRELHPDLAIVDIKMPGMDGLRMVEEMRKWNSDCKVIILTAYSDFKFAQKAVELGIECYILKPIEETELIEKICKVRDIINNKKAVEQYMNTSISMSRDRMLESVVLGEGNLELLEMNNSPYGFDFPWKSYQVLLIEMDKTDSDIVVMKSSIKREIDSFIAGLNCGFVFNINNYIGLLLKNITFESHPRVLSDLQQKIRDLCGSDITISVGLKTHSLDSLQQSYRHALGLLEKKFLYGHKRIIAAGDAEERNINKNKYQIQDDFQITATLENLFNTIDVNNMEGINNALEEVRCQFVKGIYSEEEIKINYTNMYVAVVNRLIMNNPSLKESISIKDDVLSEIHKKANLQELHGYLKYKFISISDEIAKLRPLNIMNKVLDYIDRNCSSDLKLENLAPLFNYNSAYLGKLIKSSTGMFFNTYLDLVRIEKAKHLLKEGYKVYQVAEKTGYKDIDYFYLKFKKYVGVSPSNFKFKE